MRLKEGRGAHLHHLIKAIYKKHAEKRDENINCLQWHMFNSWAPKGVKLLLKNPLPLLITEKQIGGGCSLPPCSFICHNSFHFSLPHHLPSPPLLPSLLPSRFTVYQIKLWAHPGHLGLPFWLEIDTRFWLVIIQTLTGTQREVESRSRKDLFFFFCLF